MDRRRFDHLVEELALAVRSSVPRYALWMHLHETGADPDHLSHSDAIAFCQDDAKRFVGAHGHRLGRRAHRKLLRHVEFFAPDVDRPDVVFHSRGDRA